MAICLGAHVQKVLCCGLVNSFLAQVTFRSVNFPWKEDKETVGKDIWLKFEAWADLGFFSKVKNREETGGSKHWLWAYIRKKKRIYIADFKKKWQSVALTNQINKPETDGEEGKRKG